MSWLALTLLAIAPETSVSVVEVTEPPERLILVLELQTEDESLVSAARALTEIVASELGAQQDVRVVTRADLKQMIELEAERQVTGCDQDSCLEELADAIGAELVLYGRLEPLGSTQLVSLNLFSQRSARSVARETAQGSADELPMKLRAMIPALLGVEQPAPVVVENHAAAGWLAWGGGGTLVVGGATALLALVPLTSAEASGSTKEGAFVAGWIGMGAAVLGAAGLVAGVAMGAP